MNHQPFETWLLEEQPLNIEQKRELKAHLQACKYCNALFETGLALNSKKMVSPAAGFTARFEKRLIAHHLCRHRLARRETTLAHLAGNRAFIFGHLLPSL